MQSCKLPIQVGELKQDVIALLGVPETKNVPILLGESNVNHIKNKHPKEYIKYSQYIPDILREPDYVGLNPKDSSIEYVKEFKIDNEFVKVAVRVAQSGNYFVRSLYVLNPNRVKNFIQNGTLKPT